MFGGLDDESRDLNDIWTWGRRGACQPDPGSTVHVGSMVHCVFEPVTDSQFGGWTTEGFAQKSSGQTDEKFNTLGPGPASITATLFDSGGEHTQRFDFTIVQPHR